MIGKTVKCHKCGQPIELDDRVTRGSTCPKCDSYLHCCLMCRFYDETAYNECREPQAERVVDKEKANYCSYFEISSESVPGGLTRSENAKKKLDDLFKKRGA